MNLTIRTLPILVAGAVALAACSGSTQTSTGSGAPGTTAAAPQGTIAPAGYQTVSDVTPHAAIGADVAAIKQQLAKAKDGAVDWAAVQRTFSEGGASKKGDGSVRTLEKLVDAPAVVDHVTAAISGRSGGSTAVRAQRVEKGITALLALKAIDELGSAATKIADGKTDVKDGAPHNVDEAWAFYAADGNGPQSTAKKRGDDFKKDVDGPILQQLTAAQAAAKAGDATAFATAEKGATSAINFIFYLATYKYLDTGGDEVKRAEGQSFYLPIQPLVKQAAPEADAAITAAFTSGDAAAGRAALNGAPALAALGLTPGQAITG